MKGYEGDETDGGQLIRVKKEKGLWFWFGASVLFEGLVI